MEPIKEGKSSYLVKENYNELNSNKNYYYIGARYFFSKGKYCFHPKSIGLPISLTLIIYFSTHLTFIIYSQNIGNKIYVILAINIIFLFLEIFFILIVALTNPGAFYPNYKEDCTNSNDVKYLYCKINNEDFFVKYCKTCHIARELRVFHCKICNLCILRHDHHCPWLSTCIGFNNHKKFLYLIIITFYYFLNNLLNMFLILYLKNIFIIIFINGINFNIIILFLLLVSNIIGFLFGLKLIITQIDNLNKNQTTSEKLRRSEDATNPFDLKNCKLNQSEFWYKSLEYKERIEYNKMAYSFVKKNVLIDDFLSNNYIYDEQDGIKSFTYEKIGYNKTRQKK